MYLRDLILAVPAVTNLAVINHPYASLSAAEASASVRENNSRWQLNANCSRVNAGIFCSSSAAESGLRVV